MNENEKAAFEREKENARRRIDEMYRAKPQSGGGIKFSSYAGRDSHKAGTDANLGNNNRNKEKEAPKNKETENPPHTKSEEKKTTGSDGGFNILKMLNFDNIKLDNDRLVILMLCLLLSTGEKQDDKLMLALAYIML